MSTIGDVVRDTGGVVRAMGALLGSDSARQAPQIARDLGAEAEFGRAMTRAGSAVGTAAGWVHRLHEAVTIADASVAAFAVLPAVAGRIGTAVDVAADEAAGLLQIGVDVGPLRSAGQQTQGEVTRMAGTLGVAQRINVATERVEAAVRELEALLGSLDPPAFEVLGQDIAGIARQLAAFADEVKTPVAPGPAAKPSGA